MRVLIVDDEENIRRALRFTLEAMGHEVTEAEDPAAAVVAARNAADVALVDLRLGQSNGLELIEALVRENPRLVVVAITAYASIDTAVESMRRGALDYLAKPFTPAQVRAVLERSERTRGLEDRVAELEEQVRLETPEIEFSSESQVVSRVLALAKNVAGSDAVLLLRGESGTGKGVLARLIHAWSPRAQGPFVTVSCPSLNAELLESELFGHAKGAFTGAIRDVAGKVAAAQGGTLFLDEIGEMPVTLQPKLLRFLQERKFERVGETQTRTSNARLIAATNRDLEAAVSSGAFREDLLYRLNVVELVLPPLRLRDDALRLSEHFLRFFSIRSGRRLTGFTKEAANAIAKYPWPGNLRELRNAIERAAILARGPEVGWEDLPERVGRHEGTGRPRVEVGGPVTLDELEAEHIRLTLGSATSLDAAAKTLGIDPSTLFRKRRRYGL